MARPSVPQLIEVFHLSFLTVLRSRVDVSRYVLKGGVNLRYFFASPRYSEDIDFDIAGAAGWGSSSQIDKTLKSDALRRLLAAAQITLSASDVTLQKDTPTTKRWRVLFTAEGHTERIRTKVEFSGRNGERRLDLARVPDSIVAAYALQPPLVQHYLGDAATEQKVVALAARPETQARDVFDLELLLRSFPLASEAVDPQVCSQAAEAAMALRYADFETQVAPFLEGSMAELYDQVTWENMQDRVVGALLP